MRDERLDKARPLGVLGAPRGRLEQLEAELGIGEGVVDEHLSRLVAAGPEDRARAGEGGGRLRGLPPADEDVQPGRRILPGLDDHAREPRAARPEHGHVDGPEGDPARARPEGGARPRLTVEERPEEAAQTVGPARQGEPDVRHHDSASLSSNQ